ncbi:MAG TPA: macro domain-containing protein [Candidatus Norongarragalinales archaeon]|jgi:O-acetyl-ADP-ribose deacetylase (regulator of RNase III)|nr:macro domain-containing protein [Candidatus Norongarragalinales archaeon]
MVQLLYKGVVINAKQGDLVLEDSKAIVNPANSNGQMSTGVGLAIKNAAGEQVEKDAMATAPLPIGRAIGTPSGKKLKARLVIHSPTLGRPGEKSSAQNIDKAVTAALRTATQLGVSSISFPAMGAGAGKVPLEEAARVMVQSIRFYLDKNPTSTVKEIRLVALDESVLKAFDEALLQLR